MKFLGFIIFLITACKGGLIICLGLIIRNHFHTLISLITRKPMPEEAVDLPERYQTDRLIRVFGTIVIVLGCITLLMGLFSLFGGASLGARNFNFFG